MTSQELLAPGSACQVVGWLMQPQIMIVLFVSHHVPIFVFWRVSHVKTDVWVWPSRWAISRLLHGKNIYQSIGNSGFRTIKGDSMKVKTFSLKWRVIKTTSGYRNYFAMVFYNFYHYHYRSDLYENDHRNYRKWMHNSIISMIIIIMFYNFYDHFLYHSWLPYSNWAPDFQPRFSHSRPGQPRMEISMPCTLGSLEGSSTWARIIRLVTNNNDC